jgi:hypothetical protein
MKTYISLSTIFALYFLFFFPSVVLSFIVVKQLGGFFEQPNALKSLLNILILLLPAIGAGLIFHIKKLSNRLNANFTKSKKGFILLSLGHLMAASIIAIVIDGNQLAGWTSIPIYVVGAGFYGLGLEATIDNSSENT